jgi:2-hydroxychromene-2-carboxylate isomerase
MVVEFVFDYPSPYAYLASTQLESLGVPARHEPVGIVEVMKSVNNRPSPACPPKARYSAIDVARWAHRYGVPFEINQAFLTALGTGTFDHQILTRGALVAQEFDAFAPYNAAMFAAIWGKPQDIMTEGGRAAFLKRLGIDASRFWRRAESRDLHAELQRRKEVAAQGGGGFFRLEERAIPAIASFTMKVACHWSDRTGSPRTEVICARTMTFLAHHN